jgi:uncharacterized protein YheU (UPF0270 family)
MAQLTRQRDQTTQRTGVYEEDIHALREQVERLTTANRNGEALLVNQELKCDTILVLGG